MAANCNNFVHWLVKCYEEYEIMWRHDYHCWLANVSIQFALVNERKSMKQEVKFEVVDYVYIYVTRILGIG